MQLRTKETIPQGAYHADFLGVEETDHPEYGAGLQWKWKVTAGKWLGQTVSRTTKPEATKKNSAGKFLMAISGLPWEVAKKSDLDDFIGTPCQIVVVDTEAGASRVESFVPSRRQVEGNDANAQLQQAAVETQGADLPF